MPTRVATAEPLQTVQENHSVHDYLTFINAAFHELCQAWANWWSPLISPDAPRLWGYPFVWLGRFGRTLQFLGVVTLMLDIVGVERLQSAGNRLSFRTASRKVRRIWIRTRRFVRAAFVRANSRWDSPQHKEAKRRMRCDKPLFVFWIVLVAGCGVARFAVELTHPTFVAPLGFRIPYALFEGAGGVLQGGNLCGATDYPDSNSSAVHWCNC